MEITQIEYLQSDMAGGCTFLNSPRNLVREFCEPLRIPYIVDAAWLDVTILHVKKRGLHFHEKAVSVRSDSGIHLWQNERKWFQYRFANQGLRGTAPENVRRQVMALLNSPELANLRTPPATPLRRWNDEGWHVLMHRSRVFAFVNGTEPPRDVTELFTTVETLPCRK